MPHIIVYMIYFHKLFVNMADRISLLKKNLKFFRILDSRIDIFIEIIISQCLSSPGRLMTS